MHNKMTGRSTASSSSRGSDAPMASRNKHDDPLVLVASAADTTLEASIRCAMDEHQGRFESKPSQYAHRLTWIPDQGRRLGRVVESNEDEAKNARSDGQEMRETADPDQPEERMEQSVRRQR